MTRQDAIETLLGLRTECRQYRNAVKRKHWSPAEKAATIADYNQQIKALTIAVSELEGLIKEWGDTEIPDDLLDLG